MACPECQVEDALGRHGSMCRRARQLGLPFLAEDEVPIPLDEPIPPEEAGEVDDQPTQVMPVVTPDEVAEAERTALTDYARRSADPSTMCIGCGQHHAGPSDRMIGALRVAAQCEWRLRFQGLEPHEAIDQLETTILRALENLDIGIQTDGDHHKQWAIAEAIKELGGRIPDGVDEGIPA